MIIYCNVNFDQSQFVPFQKSHHKSTEVSSVYACTKIKRAIAEKCKRSAKQIELRTSEWAKKPHVFIIKYHQDYTKMDKRDDFEKRIVALPNEREHLQLCRA